MMARYEIPAGLKFVNGWLFPTLDTDCSRVIFSMSKDLTRALAWVPKSRRDNCVQAGGNCGVWPAALAKEFGQVYTAEPHPLNFAALVYNTARFQNVTKLQAAFGFERKKLRLELAAHEQANCGAFFVQEGGNIPTLQIDDLNLESCGLIYLDIEGYESPALQGACRTIRKCHPVIVIEDKGLSEKYGVAKGGVEKWLAAEFDYIVLERVNKDVILGQRADFPGVTPA